MPIEARKCPYCAHGWRHPVGNCVLCGWGPAPALPWECYGLDHKPETLAEHAMGLASIGIAGELAALTLRAIKQEGNPQTRKAVEYENERALRKDIAAARDVLVAGSPLQPSTEILAEMEEGLKALAAVDARGRS